MVTTTEEKLCITSATGGLGSLVLHHLLHTLHISPSRLILSLRDPSRLPSKYTALSLDVRHGDYNAPETLPTAFASATKLLLISYPSIAHSARVTAHRHAIDVARSAGIRHICYTSLAFSPSGSPPTPSTAAVMSAHHATESYLQSVCDSSAGSMTYTIIREGIYAESYPLYLGFFDPASMSNPRDRKVLLPSSGGPGVAWATKSDLAEGTARILAEMPANADSVRPSDFVNATVLLSGSAPLPLSSVAGIVSKYLGWEDHPLQIDAVGTEAYVDYQLERRASSKSNPPTREFLEAWSTTYPAMERGDTAVVDPLLRDLLGRDIMSMEERLKELLGR
jgi:uncharacterized protein YbjT (DUF2867 family)